MTKEQKQMIEMFQKNLFLVLEEIRDQELKCAFALQSGFLIGLTYRLELESKKLPEAGGV